MMTLSHGIIQFKATGVVNEKIKGRKRLMSSLNSFPLMLNSIAVFSGFMYSTGRTRLKGRLRSEQNSLFYAQDA